jgi:hypothetical protein
MPYVIPTGFDQEAWDWIVQDARQKLAWAKGKRGKVPSHIVAKAQATKRANRAKAKRERKMHFRQVKKDNFRELQAAWRARGIAQHHVLAAMDPGHWYALADIAAASGVPVRTVKSLCTFRLSRDGIVCRADNPAFVKIVANQYTVKPREDREPMHLWSLTDAGCIARKQALQELERLGWPKYATIQKDPP